MKTARFSLLLVAALSLGGCAATAADSAEAPESSDAALSSGLHRVAVAPPVDAVISEYLKLFTASFDRAKSRHASIHTITKDNVDAFTTVEVNLGTVLDQYLSERHVASLAVDDVVAKVSSFAAGKIRAAAGADGKVGDSLDEVPTGLSNFFSQARDTLAEPMLRDALKSSPGIDVNKMLDEWKRVSNFVGGSFGDVFTGASPSLEAPKVIRILGIDEVTRTETGPAAVDAFEKALVSADGRFLDTLLGMWRSPSVKSAYFYEYGDDGVGGIVLAIVDARGQLFSFTIEIES